MTAPSGAASAPSAHPFAGVAELGRPLIDVDIHAHLEGTDALEPYLEPQWREYGRERNWGGPAAAQLLYPPEAGSTVRAEWRPPEGRLAAGDVDLVREHVLDPLGVEVGILTCYSGVDVLRHPYWAKAIAAAVNDWLIAEWLEPEPRLRASMVVPGRDPAAALAEIERVGSHPGFVQVLMPTRTDQLYGKHAWHPVWAAMERHDLVVGLHRGGASEVAPSTTGWPSWYVEEYVAEVQVFAAHLTSLVAEGVFELFPGLRVSLLESGFTWLPPWWWRMDADWKGLRREVPWLKRRPSEILRDHVRASVTPGDYDLIGDVRQVVDWLETEDLLMFATDYPHVHDEDVVGLLNAVSPTMRDNILAGTARTWYRLP